MYKNMLKAVALASALTVSLAAKDVRKAYVDVDALVGGSEYGAEVSEIAQKQQKQIEALLHELQGKLEKERKDLLQSAETFGYGNLTEAKIQNELTSSRKASEVLLEKSRVNATLEVEKANQECRKKIKSLVAEYAKAHGYDEVLDLKDEKVLFIGTGLDKTEAIKEYITEQFKSEKRRSSLLASVTNAEAKDAKNSSLLAAVSEDKGAEKALMHVEKHAAKNA